MPFTLVHPLAILPFRRIGIFSALIIGSMSPDFRRLAVPFGESTGHTWTSALVYYLPSALLCIFVFHRLLKLPMISLAPRRLQPWLLRSSQDFRIWPFSRVNAIVMSASAGIATHLIWDSFTHPGGWALQQLHLDSARVHLAPNYALSSAQFFQDASSGGGMILLCFLLAKAVTRNSLPPQDRKIVVPSSKILGLNKAALISSGLVIALLPGVTMLVRDPHYWLTNERRQLVGFFVVSTLDVLLLEMVVFAVIWHVRNPQKQECQEDSLT